MNQDLTFMGNQFDEILEIIDNARTRAMRAVNAELISVKVNTGPAQRKKGAQKRPCKRLFFARSESIFNQI